MIAFPICPGIESRSIIVEVAAGAALPATAGDTATAAAAGGVCGIGDAIIIYEIYKR